MPSARRKLRRKMIRKKKRKEFVTWIWNGLWRTTHTHRQDLHQLLEDSVHRAVCTLFAVLVNGTTVEWWMHALCLDVNFRIKTTSTMHTLSVFLRAARSFAENKSIAHTIDRVYCCGTTPCASACAKLQWLGRQFSVFSPLILTMIAVCGRQNARAHAIQPSNRSRSAAWLLDC